MKTIETKIAKNGTASVYVNGKRTNRKDAVEFAKENGLPIYQASYLSYTDRSNDETFATATAAYAWLTSKANSNRNIADGSWTITRIAPNQTFLSGTDIYEHTPNVEEVNADDEPEFATFIYAKIGEEHIKDRYEDMVQFFNQLVEDGLTKEQAEQVITVYAGKPNGLDHCKLIKEFKAQNAAKISEANVEDYVVTVEAQNAAVDAEIEQATAANEELAGNNDKQIAAIEKEIALLLEEMKEIATGLQMFKDYPEQYSQEFIDEREELYDSLSREYRKLADELENLQAAETELDTAIDALGAEEEALTHQIDKLSAVFDEKFSKLERYDEEIYERSCDGHTKTMLAPMEAERDRLALEVGKITEEITALIEKRKPIQEKLADLICQQIKLDSRVKMIDCEEFAGTFTSNEDIAAHLEAGAPEGWTIQPGTKKLCVKYHEQPVADVEQVTERDLIAPESFFRQFEPLIDETKTPEQMFLDDRYRELKQLEEMRRDCADGQHPPDTLKRLDAMIEQVKRDIAAAEFGERDTIGSFCKAGALDNDGNIWF